MEEKKLTGYPSVDKPQYRYYRTTPVREIDKDQTIYELVFDSNKDNMEDLALEYLGVNWTYAKLRAETDQAADAFAKAGLSMGDVVLIGVSNCFEAVVSLLALNKLGIISKWFDIRASQKDIIDYANDSNCKMLIAFDLLLPKVEPILNQTSLQKVLVIRPSDALSKLHQLAYYLKCKREGKYIPIPTDPRYLRFSDFVKGGHKQSVVPCVPFDRNRPSVMIQSSGTTGKPKIIVHSDYSATACTYSLAYCDTPLDRGKVLLNLLPPWIAYALGEAILYPLGLGSKVVLSPTFEPEELPKYIGKFTAAFAAPFHYRYLYDHIDELTEKKKQELYKVDCFVSGGDKMSVEENAKFEEVFQTVLMNGYGNNEGWGCLTNNSVFHNRYGTVGIPKYGETVIAYDSETGKELPYGEVGEVCVLAETMFLYYEGRPEETLTVKQMHPDGKVWLHTGDLGMIDEDGFLTLQGRARRVIVRRGFKISAYTIEDKICEHPAVKECVAVEVVDPEEEHVPMVFIVLKDTYSADENVRESMLAKCKSELKEYEVPKHIQFVKQLPYTQNNKYDFRTLEKLGNAYVEKHRT